LYVVIYVKEHDVFERQGDDIYVKVPVSFAVAALGGEIEVPTLSGKAKLKIPSGTQNNTVFRMKGKGIPYLHGYGTGNENVEVVVEVPKKLSKKQKELLKEFAKEGKKKGFLEKILE
jgi:molecular chaperone DnaJ